jgi:excisionase family DNA binding protein
MTQSAGDYLIGGAVVLPGRLAALLVRMAGRDKLAMLRLNCRDTDAEAHGALLALVLAAQMYEEIRGSADGTKLATAKAFPGELTRWVSSLEAAERLGITSRAVRRAAAEGRLRGRQVGNGWVFDPVDVEVFRMEREARAS